METVCDVHRVINNDTTPRDCVWCAMCEAWICKEDLNRWDRRTRAAAKNWGRKTAQEYKGTGCGGCGKGK